MTGCQRLSELLDEVAEAALGFGVFDEGYNDALWRRVAEATGRDPDSGNHIEWRHPR